MGRMFRALVFSAAALLVLFAGAAAAAPPMLRAGVRERIARVQKGKISDAMHVYWASPLSPSEVLVTPYLERTEVDSQFEIIDQRGYVGRARVHRVEVIQGGCPDVRFWNGTARVDARQQDQQAQTVMVALPLSRRDLSRARVMLPEELRDVPRFETRKFADVGLDLDGNGSADLVRYYYDCPPPKGAGTAYSYGYCMDVLARDKAQTWKLLETVVVPECY